MIYEDWQWQAAARWPECRAICPCLSEDIDVEFCEGCSEYVGDALSIIPDGCPPTCTWCDGRGYIPADEAAMGWALLGVLFQTPNGIAMIEDRTWMGESHPDRWGVSAMLPVKYQRSSATTMLEALARAALALPLEAAE
jgi:hypothetical protein